MSRRHARSLYTPADSPTPPTASETIESLFYLYRITGQQIFRDYAWEAFQAMKRYLDTGNGWMCLINVNDLSSSAYDETQTFVSRARLEAAHRDTEADLMRCLPALCRDAQVPLVSCCVFE